MTSPETRRPPLDRTAVADVTAYWRVEIVEETASTNADVAERARAGEPAGLVLVAEHQTAGRGRLDRTWEAPARAGLTFSVLLRPAVDAAQWPWLPLVAGLALARGVRRTTGLSGVGLKWPNDLLVSGKKAAGILAERIDTPEGAAAVVGIGLNVTTTAEELPVPEATSLSLAGVEVDRATVLREVLADLGSALETWEADAEALRAAYTDLCETVGQVVQVTLPTGETLRGRAVGIDDEGRLDVETDERHTAVRAGDVVHVR